MGQPFLFRHKFSGFILKGRFCPEGILFGDVFSEDVTPISPTVVDG